MNETLLSYIRRVRRTLTPASGVFASAILFAWAVTARGEEPASGAARSVEGAKLAIEVIAGLSKWIGEQIGGCSVAALGAAGGNDCNSDVKECMRTGWFSASCKDGDARSENDCGVV